MYKSRTKSSHAYAAIIGDRYNSISLPLLRNGYESVIDCDSHPEIETINFAT